MFSKELLIHEKKVHRNEHRLKVSTGSEAAVLGSFVLMIYHNCSWALVSTAKLLS